MWFTSINCASDKGGGIQYSLTKDRKAHYMERYHEISRRAADIRDRHRDIQSVFSAGRISEYPGFSL